MKMMKMFLVLAVLAMCAVTASAQTDLPFEMYGDKVEVDVSQFEDDPLGHPGLYGWASPDGNVLAITLGGKLLVSHYPDFSFQEVFDISNWTYDFPHDNFIYTAKVHPDNEHVILTVSIQYPDGLKKALVSVNIATGDAEVLVEEGLICEWSSDGRYMLYYIPQSPDPGDYAIYDSVTGESTLLYDMVDWDVTDISSVVFAPDGNSFYFMNNVTENTPSQLFCAALDGSFITQLTNFQTTQNGEAVNNLYIRGISPDGEWIVLDEGAYDYLLMYELSSNRVFSFFTGEEFSNDLHEVIEYINEFEQRFAGIDEGEEYSVSGGTVTYSINGNAYDYDAFHLIRPRFIGWHPNGETMVIWGRCIGPDLGFYYKSFNPEFYGGTAAAVDAGTPEAFATLANYPNPFNPVTTMSFTVPASGYTELCVYNLAGQKVRELVAGTLASGSYEVVWDGRDDHGNPVSSGVFVSRLKTGDTVVTNRMTLVK